MTTDEQRLVDLADAVLDARPVDWTRAAAEASDSTRAAIGHLQSVAGISSFHLESSISAASGLSRISSAEPSGRDRGPLGGPAACPAAWGPLTIVGKIGHGRFGDVYRAIDPRLDRPVALKLLRHQEPGSEPAESAAIDEGRLLARVRHPNVVTVYGAERIDGCVGLWMELVEGRTLEDELRERGPLPWEEATRIGIDLGRALAAVHRAGLLHRDLKAQNVLREVDGRVVLADFGAGQILTSGTEAPVDLAGTPLYLAPEVIAGAPSTSLSDVYSLGVLLFHLVTGSYPVRGRSLADLREAHRQHRRSRLRDARSDLPAAFIDIVDRALAVEPRDRSATADALSDDLTRLVARDATSTRRPDTGTADTRASVVAGRARLAASAGVVVTLAVGASILLLRPWKPDSPTTNRQRAAGVDQDVPALRKLRLPSFEMGLPSHDGRVFPYFSERGHLQLWEVATGRSRPLTDAPPSGESGLKSAASPTGDRVAYGWSLGQSGWELRMINADGTWPRVLITRQTAYEPMPVDWSRDGRDVLCWLRQKNGSADLVLVPVDGGAPRLVHTLPADAPVHARLSPDGRYVVTSQLADPNSPNGVAVLIRTEGAAPRTLAENVVAGVAPVWTPDGEHVMFLRQSAGRRGPSDAWIIRVTDGGPQGEPRMVIPNHGIVFSFGLTGRAEHYRTLRTESTDVYTARIDLTGASAAGPPSRISSTEVGNHSSPTWSPDGRSMAYFTTSTRDIPGAVPDRLLTIQEMRSGRAHPLPLRLAFLSGYSPRWSVDGRSVVVFGQADASDQRFGHYRVDVQTGAMTAVGATSSTSYPPFADYAPDSRHYFYVDHPRGIVSRRLTDGAEHVVVPLGARSEIGRFAIAPDGHAIAFIGSTEHQGRWTTALEIQQTGQPSRVLVQRTSPLRLALHGWTPDSRDVVYSDGHTVNPYKLLRRSAAGGQPVDLQFSLPATPNPISLSPDGRQIAYTERVLELELWISPFTVPPPK